MRSGCRTRPLRVIELLWSCWRRQGGSRTTSTATSDGQGGSCSRQRGEEIARAAWWGHVQPVSNFWRWEQAAPQAVAPPLMHAGLYRSSFLSFFLATLCPRSVATLRGLWLRSRAVTRSDLGLASLGGLNTPCLPTIYYVTKATDAQLCFNRQLQRKVRLRRTNCKEQRSFRVEGLR
ncbi:hypothetical protein HaLaN_08990 [Haematococcus lacustris]|uniref:Uncharacterized protein n=1 Tax=Haematococcus lacustris TaxID=44745 RepID=A0A699Z2D8_HAELA|nr:hypothetical protein HaLaN_08990 [Haematococcus lacustris]